MAHLPELHRLCSESFLNVTPDGDMTLWPNCAYAFAALREGAAGGAVRAPLFLFCLFAFLFACLVCGFFVVVLVVCLFLLFVLCCLIW